MQTEKELQEELESLNSQVANHNSEIIKLREKAFRVAGKIELLQEQAETKKK